MLLAASLSACGGGSGGSNLSEGGGISYAHRTISPEMDCGEIQRIYESNIRSLDQVLEYKLSTSTKNPGVQMTAVMGGLAGGSAYLITMQNRSDQAHDDMNQVIKQNRRLEALAQEKNCQPLFPTMDIVQADLSAKESAQLTQWEEDRKAAEEMDKKFQKLN